MPRSSAVFVVALALAAFSRPVCADDAQAAAAAAAAQAVGGAAAGGVVPGKTAGSGSGGHFQRALGAPAIPRASGGASKAKSGGKKSAKKASKAAKRATESKYKSRELVENTETAYRFDENGNPLASSSKKKTPAKPEKKSSSAVDDKDDKPGACSTDEPCTVKNSDADAL
jgi:hypothetical protein